MSLFLITGTSGTGKTTVCRVLKDRGYEAYDTDDDGLARWQNNETGYVHPKSSVKAEQRTAAFIAENTWSVPRSYLEDLQKGSGEKAIFICGVLGNEDKVRDIFKAVLALYVDDKTLQHRLTTRTNNDWGKQPHELEQTLEHHHRIYDEYKLRGDIVIDATRSVDEIVDDIIHATSV